MSAKIQNPSQTGTWTGWDEPETPEEIELLDCPHCGNPPRHTYRCGPYPHTLACHCQEENIETSPSRDYETAATEWNEMAMVTGLRLAEEKQREKKMGMYIALARLTRQRHPERKEQIGRYLKKARELQQPVIQGNTQ